MNENAVVEKKVHKKNGRRVCGHCGGYLRFYRGTLSCLLCGRDVDHACKDCIASQDLLVKTA